MNHPAAPRLTLRIVHVVLDLHEGGLERLVTDLVLDARSSGDQPHVVCLRQAGQLAAELAPHEISVIPQGRLSMLAPVGLAAHFRRLAPDVVHLHSGVWFKGAYAARLAGAGPVVFTDHGRPHPDPLASRLLDGLGARLTSTTVAVSKELGAYLIRRLRVPAARLRVIPNGIHLMDPPDEATRISVRGELGLPPGVAVVGSVGRLDRVKAYDRLLEAVAGLLGKSDRTAPSPVLLLIGDGPERAALEAQAEALDLRKAVRFLGWRSDARRLLAALDLFVLPSDSEGTSVALLEAMAAGVPVVATAVGGTPSVLGKSGAGLLVPAGDTAALVQAMATMLRDPGGRQSAGRKGRQRVQEAYSFEGMAAAYRTLYAELRAAFRAP